MLFDRPEIQKMEEQDREVLAKGKIDWISKILPIAKEIMECDDRLSDDKLTYYSRAGIKTPEGIIKTHQDENEWGAKIIEYRKAQKERLIQAKRKLEDLITLISDKDRNEAVETLANKIKDWERREVSIEEDYQYPWSDVALSLLRFPEEVEFDYNDCPYCGGKQIKLHFHSPKSTWAMMCGVAGEMTICPNCQLETEFNETVRN